MASAATDLVERLRERADVEEFHFRDKDTAGIMREAAAALEAPVKVWAVRFSNYEPPEIDSLHSTREKAEAHIKEAMGDIPTDWHPEEWEVA